MKFLFLVSVAFLFAFSGCSKKVDTKLEVFRLESNVYDIGNSVNEVNLVANVKGFQVKESNKSFSWKLTYTVDLENGTGDKIESIMHGKDEKTVPERPEDTRLDIQFTTDKIVPGDYTISLKIKDEISGASIVYNQKFKYKN